MFEKTAKLFPVFLSFHRHNITSKILNNYFRLINIGAITAIDYLLYQYITAFLEIKNGFGIAEN